jgi:PAS domain S-box-containing protein
MNDRTLHTETDRRQLQQIITGLTEGVILVEPDQRILWANEAALKMHGVEKVDDLGHDVTEYRQRFRLRYRNNHNLLVGQYPIERVIAGECFTDVVVEVFPADNDEVNWVHRVRSLVLTNSQGDPDCLALILHDATAWASAEQRFERTFNANPAPAVICRLSDQRYMKVNQGFLEMTGYVREQVIGRSVYELDVFENAEKRDLAIERLGEGSTIPQMEAELRLPDGGNKPVVVAGQPIDIGEEDCMLFTFMDLEPRRKAESTLRQSEERFQKAFRMLPVPSAVLNAETFVLLDMNDAFTATLGYAAEDLVGRSSDDTHLWSGDVRTQIERLLSSGSGVKNVEFDIKRKDGEIINCLVSAETVSINQQDCIMMAWLDITDRKRSEMELVSAIETVMQDASWFSKSLIEKLTNVKRANAPAFPTGRLSDLTARERDVFDLICQGMADKEIAKNLSLSLNTVRNHVATIYAKLDVHSRSETIVWARENNYFAFQRNKNDG